MLALLVDKSHLSALTNNSNPTIPAPPSSHASQSAIAHWLLMSTLRLTTRALAQLSHRKSRFSLTQCAALQLFFSSHKLNPFVFTLLFVQMRMMEGKTDGRMKQRLLTPFSSWFFNLMERR